MFASPIKQSINIGYDNLSTKRICTVHLFLFLFQEYLLDVSGMLLGYFTAQYYIIIHNNTIQYCTILHIFTQSHYNTQLYDTILHNTMICGTILCYTVQSIQFSQCSSVQFSCSI